MNSETAKGVAELLSEARSEGRLLPPLSDSMELSFDDAYAVQRAGLGLRLLHGERLVGWKLGYTSQVMRTQMGVSAPNFGPLTDVMRMESGANLAGALTQPRVEPELLLVLGEDGAVVRVHAALEVVDSVFVDYRFTLADNTADGSSAARFVVGPQLPVDPDALASVRVEMFVDGRSVETATGAAADGDPRRGVSWLREQLLARGDIARAGDVVMSGGLTKAHPLRSGSTISARFDDAYEVTVSR